MFCFNENYERNVNDREGKKEEKGRKINSFFCMKKTEEAGLLLLFITSVNHYKNKLSIWTKHCEQVFSTFHFKGLHDVLAAGAQSRTFFC